MREKVVSHSKSPIRWITPAGLFLLRWYYSKSPIRWITHWRCKLTFFWHSKSPIRWITRNRRIEYDRYYSKSPIRWITVPQQPQNHYTIRILNFLIKIPKFLPSTSKPLFSRVLKPPKKFGYFGWIIIENIHVLNFWLIVRIIL